MSERTFVDYPFDERWLVQVATGLYAGFQRHRNQPSEWMGEVTIRPSFLLANEPTDDLDDVLCRAGAAWCYALGWHVGERPRVEPDSRKLIEGGRRVQYRVTVLVTVPAWWEPPEVAGQQSLWSVAS